MLFLAVFMLASVPSTGLTLHFLRPYRALWAVLSALALVYAATAVPAVLDHWASRHGLPDDFSSPWSVLLSLRLILAPFSACAFLFVALFAHGKYRLCLLVAASSEAIAFAGLAASWMM